MLGPLMCGLEVRGEPSAFLAAEASGERLLPRGKWACGPELHPEDVTAAGRGPLFRRSL